MNATSWSAIVVTCQSINHSHAVQSELDLYLAKGRIPKDVLVLAIDDPKPRIGSGSATLNALLVVTEHLSARAGYTVVEAQVLKNARILILHMGRYFPFSSVGRAFTALPCMRFDPSYSAVPEDFASNFESLLVTLSSILAVDSPPGVWVCSTDMMLGIPPEIVIDWSDAKGVRIFSIPSEVDYARDHGVIQMGENNDVENIFYLASDEEMKKCKLSTGCVPIAPVLVYVSTETAMKFLLIINISPLDSCTYLGLDQGGQPCQLAFVWDILLLMAKNVSESDFVSGDRSMSYGRKTLADGSIAETRRNMSTKDTSQESRFFMKQARKILWRELRGTPLKTVLLDGACFDYMSAFGANHRRQILDCPLQHVDMNNNLPFQYNRTVHSYFETNCKPDENCVIINSLLADQVEIKKDCVLSHCRIDGPITVHEGCILAAISSDVITESSVQYEIPEDTVLQTFQLSMAKIIPQNLQKSHAIRIMVVFGVHDFLKVPVSDSRSTYCNKSWNEFFARTGIRANELWGPDLSEHEQSFFNAKLFPLFYPGTNIGLRDMLWLRGAPCAHSTDAVKNWRSSWRLSLKEILDAIDISAEFEWQRRLYYEVGRRRMKETLEGAKNNCLLPFFKNSVVENYGLELLKELDNVACNSGSADCVARTLSCIADVLSEMAGDKSRSGPAANESWMYAYRLLEKRDINAGITELANQRDKWLGRSDLLIRAARHYEGAMQILIRHAVMTARQFVQFSPKSQPPIGQWFIAETPARIDLSGAWSDTPPVTYEHGGAVTNIAIKIRGKKPIGAKVRKIHELQLLLVIGNGKDAIRLTVNKISDLQNYSKPNAPGALLKAAVCCANIIDLTSSKTLQQQLKEKYGAGFEVQSWSNLPQGSGLGASSILSGALMAALLSAAGINYDTDSLIHAVLHLEQMLTTGGGWQDQVGGLLPGIKLGQSEGKLPLKVESEVLKIDDQKMKRIVDHSLLVFTGKPRLAKNMLQGVIRNWYTRKPEVIKTADWIESNARDCAQACVEGDVKKIGKCLSNSWEQKKIIAPGCEPPQVKELIDVLKPHIHGFLLTGAGGGGFLYAITKEAKFSEKVPELIKGLGGQRSEEHYKLELDEEGLTVRTE
ncbi:L-fucose kinase-like [Dendronephthya gigantea]|uniref:L-fucose kinase-like n=1 Tax=Dendronephthya gigantea TaxID=151771 RepID=UPI001068E361|nr:L-fucose kinase-like [Dendronephthya gigantea]